MGDRSWMKSPINHEFITLIQDLLLMRTKIEYVLSFLVFLKALRLLQFQAEKAIKKGIISSEFSICFVQRMVDQVF